MTKKHFEAIAKALYDGAFCDEGQGFKGGYCLTDEEHNGYRCAIARVSDTLAALYPTFNKAKFLAATERPK